MLLCQCRKRSHALQRILQTIAIDVDGIGRLAKQLRDGRSKEPVPIGVFPVDL